jgi:hypothetical protein
MTSHPVSLENDDDNEDKDDNYDDDDNNNNNNSSSNFSFKLFCFSISSQSVD